MNMSFEDRMNNEKIVDKKLDYGFEKNNYMLGGEITVQITLSEYRELVRSDATKRHDIEEANDGKWKREQENKSLRDENQRLKEEIYELKKRLEQYTCEHIEEEKEEET